MRRFAAAVSDRKADNEYSTTARMKSALAHTALALDAAGCMLRAGLLGGLPLGLPLGLPSLLERLDAASAGATGCSANVTVINS